VQLLDPWFAGGANKPSLVQAQANYVACGAMESRFVGNVRGVLPGDVRDCEWRPLTEHDRRFTRVPRDLSDSEYGDLSVWYYWKRRVHGESEEGNVA
jgi:hypothetical protein